MKIYIGTAQKVAEMAAERYVELLRSKPNAILGFATGSTPLDLYAQLAKLNREKKITFKDVVSFNLDEYVGLDGSHDQSYRYFMNTNLFSKIDIDVNKTHVPSGLDVSLAGEYDKMIEAAGGIDMQLLGLGNNGHIGFNEPGTPFGSTTHVVELTENTRQANARFFKSIDEVPTHAVTMGIKTVMNARKVILMALGEKKAPIIKATLQGEVTPEVPASILQLHPDVEFYLDEQAAALL